MESSILTILTFLPVVGAAVILLLKPLFRRETDEAIKGVALWTSIITLIVSIIVLLMYDSGVSGLQLESRANWIPIWGIQYFLAIDGLSILMVLLTTFISVLSVASSFTAIETNIKQYYIFMLLLETGMLGVGRSTPKSG